MDPIANRKAQLKAARLILAVWDKCDDNGDLTEAQALQVADEALTLAELVTALAGWEAKQQ